MISSAVSSIFELIFLVLFITILLTWVPNINWQNQPFACMKSFSEIFFAPFRKLIPPIGMIDISPIAAFFCLSIFSKLVVSLLVSIGL